MPRPTNDERLQAVHAEAVREFDKIQTTVRLERQQCIDDRRFYSIAGAQWEGELGEQFENKPKFEVNKVHLSVIRIINEYRNNRISVRFVTKDGVKDDDLADACAGLFRADEHDSGAEEAYDNAFEEAVGGGFGALRLRTTYEDDEDPDNDHQRIRIEPIFDADTSVFFDLDAKRQDKADARHCFLVHSMTPEAYKEEWDDDPQTWDKGIGSTVFDWATPDVVYIAEYYRIEAKGDEAITYEGVAGDERKVLKSELDDEQAAQLAATGYREVRRKRIKVRKVHKYILSGGGVLEDCGIIAGKNIPVVPAYGKRWFIDNIERCMGHVRLVKDAQRLKNMQLSKLGELTAAPSVEKPIFTPEQIAGFENLWSEDGIKNFPYLLTNPITDASGNPMPAGPLAYTKPPQVPQALAALLQLTESDMKDVLGNQQEADKMVSNIAEKTVLAIQKRMDMQTYIYVSNFAKTIRRVGEVWLSMAKDVYVEEGRRMKTIGMSDGEVGTVTLQQPTKDPNDGGLTTGVDMDRAAFDVAVEVGPSSESRRESTVNSLTGLMQITQDPETNAVLLAMAIMNMQGEGISEVRDYFRKKLVKLGAVKPNDEEQQQMQAAAANAKPDPQEVLAAGMAEEAQAKGAKARVEVLETIANTEKIKAETIATLAEVDMASTEQALAAADKILGGGQPAQQ